MKGTQICYERPNAMYLDCLTNGTIEMEGCIIYIDYTSHARGRMFHTANRSGEFAQIKALLCQKDLLSCQLGKSYAFRVGKKAVSGLLLQLVDANGKASSTPNGLTEFVLVVTSCLMFTDGRYNYAEHISESVDDYDMEQSDLLMNGYTNKAHLREVFYTCA